MSCTAHSYLQNNKLKDIDQSTFGVLPNLNMLYVGLYWRGRGKNACEANERPTAVEIQGADKLFRSPHCAHMLCHRVLDNNLLTSVPRGAFNSLESLVTLYVLHD
jgi:hypothetical protein